MRKLPIRGSLAIAGVLTTGNVGETGDMDAGASNTFTVTLPTGHYLPMCNELGHDAAGMHMAFTVN